MKKALPLIALSLTISLAACEDTEGETATIGSGKVCQKRLAAALTPGYLRDEHEIASVDALTLKVFIVESCRELPSDFSVEDAAEYAGGELFNYIKDETL